MAPTLLLDLDGTLTDSKPGILASYTAAVQALGHTPDPAIDLTPFVGPPIADAMRAILAAYGDTRVTAGVDAFRAFYGASAMFDSTVYAGVPAMLDAARGRGCRLFLATSKRQAFAQRILEHFGLAGFFDGIYGAIPGAALDHKPALIAHILASEAVDPAHTLMVGDRNFDIAGAHANHVRAAGALWGYGAPGELEQAGADWLMPTPGALAQALTDGSVLAL